MAYPVGQAMYSPIYAPVPGYEGLLPAAGGGFLPPPPIQPLPSPNSQPAQDLNIPALTEDEAREAFCNYASSHCCYSDGPAKEGVITNMEHFNTFRYRLETFTESRKTEWTTKPWDGNPLNVNAPLPTNPWEIPVKPPTLFKDEDQEVEVPSTASLKPCETCIATGKTRCDDCNGSGYIKCHQCNGSGYTPDQQQCGHCSGTTKEKCSRCSGQGTVNCDACKGKAQVISYIKLSVQWKNNTDDYTTDQSSGLKAGKLQNASGKQLYKDAMYMVYPLSGFPHQDVAQASDRLIREHHQKYSQSARIQQQQHSVELISITKVTYKWKEKVHIYYVYGNEHKVNAEDYPAQCCCVIL